MHQREVEVKCNLRIPIIRKTDESRDRPEESASAGLGLRAEPAVEENIRHVRSIVYSHRRHQRRARPEAPGLRRVRQDRGNMAAPSHLPELRGDALLRLFTESPRDQARKVQRASGRRVGGAW